MNVEQRHDKNFETGFYIKHLNTGKVWKQNENTLFPLASVAKMIASVFVSKYNESIPQGLINQAIAEHSNTAYQSILSIQNENAINQFLHNHQYKLCISRDNRDIDSNCGSPFSLAAFIENAIFGDLLPASSKQLIYESLKNQMDDDGFRLNTAGTWAHMTGGLETLCADIGILEHNHEKIIFCGFANARHNNIEWALLEQQLTQIGQYILNDLPTLTGHKSTQFRV
jgi:hypothetical protein